MTKKLRRQSNVNELEINKRSKISFVICDQSMAVIKTTISSHISLCLILNHAVAGTHNLK